MFIAYGIEQRALHVSGSGDLSQQFEQSCLFLFGQIFQHTYKIGFRLWSQTHLEIAVFVGVSHLLHQLLLDIAFQHHDDFGIHAAAVMLGQLPDLVTQAHALGYDAIGIADANTMAGVVRLHGEARTLKLRPVIGCRIETVEGLTFLAYPQDRKAYGRLCQLISAGRMTTPEGDWQNKGVCQITLPMLAEWSEGLILVLVPPRDLEQRYTIEIESNVIPLRRPGLDPGPVALLSRARIWLPAVPGRARDDGYPRAYTFSRLILPLSSKR